MDLNKIDTKKYWESRLNQTVNLQAVGHRAFNLSYNEWLYKAQRDSMDMIFQRNDISLSGKRVMDIGSGSGFYIQYFMEHGVEAITGIDITKSSIRYLQEKYSNEDFFVADISSPELKIPGPFDVISAISVLFHIVEDDKFLQAVTNICHFTNPKGYILISDSFKRPLIPTAKHVRLRDIEDYETVLEQNNVKIIDIVPVFYLLNQTFIPYIIPPVINLLGLGSLFYKIDTQLRKRGSGNGRSGKFLLAQKNS